MKADFPIVEVDALPAELRQRVGTPLYRALTQQRTMLQSNLTHRDNFNCAVVEWSFKHGVETLFSNPLPNGVTPLGFEVIEAWDPTTRSPMSVVGTPLFNRVRRDDGMLPITVNYDLRHTEPRLRVTKNAAQSLANNTNESLTWQTLIRQFPVPATPGISNGIIYVDSGTASRIRVTEAGQYLVSASVYFATSAVGVRDLWFAKNGSAAERWGTTQIINAGAVETGITATDQVPMVPGDYLTILAFQNSGGALNALSTGFPTSVAINRLYNDSTPTGIVRGIVWGG